jgi:hypothetical protein
MFFFLEDPVFGNLLPLLGAVGLAQSGALGLLRRHDAAAGG